MLKTIIILALLSFNMLSLGFVTSEFHVLQRHDYALAPNPYTKAPFPLFPILYAYVTIGNNQELIVSANFSSTYTLIVFTPIQFQYWALNSSSKAMYVKQISRGTYYIPLPPGTYAVVINHAINASTKQIKLYVTGLNFYSIFLSPRTSVATGIASYGFYNYSGVFVPYRINTTAILGYFNITSLSTKGHSATLQMNAVLQINGRNSQQLWLQNVIIFDTYLKLFSLQDQIWNFSSYLANLTQAVGKGNIQTYLDRTYYAHTSFWYSNVSYSLPFAGYLITNVSVVKGKGVYVYFGFVIIQSGKIIPPSVVYYDKVFISCPDVSSAYILVQPNFTGSLNPYDVELVFTGYYMSSNAIFTSLQAQLTLMYYDNGRWVDFPSLLSYGLNTQETAGNAITVIEEGNAFVKIGSSTGYFLTNNFNGKIPGFTYVNYSGQAFYTSSPILISFPNYELIGSDVNYTLTKILVYVNGDETIVPNNYAIQPLSWFGTITIIPEYMTCYKVTIKYPNGSYTSWYPSGSRIDLPKTIYVSSNIRYLLNSSESEVIITQPEILSPPYILQYYVNIKIVNETISGWYNNGSVVFIPSVIQFSSSERYLINYSKQIVVTSPINLTLPYILQYRVIINLPNGTIKGWYDNGSIINVPEVINMNTTKYVLNSSQVIIVTTSLNYTPTYTVQYLVGIILPNGTTIYKYVNNDSEIQLPKVIQISNDTRYVLNSSSDRVVITSSGIIKPAYVLQYLVNINGKTEWVNEGEKITVEIFTTPFLLVKWVGNIHVNNGETIVIDKPIYLKVIEEPSPIDYVIVALVAIIFVLTRLIRRKKS